MKNIIFVLLLCAFSAFLSIEAKAQFGNDFQLANRFMQQQNYEAALPIFEKLVNNNPTEYYFFERYMKCFIQLKQYDEGLQAIKKIEPTPNFSAQAKVVEGQLHHFKGDTSKAYSIWDKNLQQNEKNLQIYILTANIMSEMNEFDKAVNVLRSARIKFKNPQLFFNDISSTLLQSGNYEGAVNEWIAWLIAQPDQTPNIQRLLLRFNDPLLNDIAILEIDDKLNELAVNNPAYNTLFRFQIWLLQENKLYRRALVSATAFEKSTSNFNYSLFQLGRSLKRNKEFDLATKAFTYYIENAQGNVKWQSQEELAKVYTEWAKQIEDYSLDFNNQKEKLFTQALEQLNFIIQNAPNYRYLSRVLLLKSEIVLDHLQNIDEAKNILSKLKELNNNSETAEELYISGRIHIATEEYAQARIALTKSNKIAEIGELAEKTRYFLALTDFFSSDFEFAVIQLKSLGRQNTSYYANDALELRLWIQKGLNADSAGTSLEPFADAYFESITGNHEDAKNKLLALLESENQTPLYDDVILLLSKNASLSPDQKFDLTNSSLFQGKTLSNRERVMWERAKYADLAYSSSTNDPDSEDPAFISASKVQDYYEELILTYPQGFYAPYARKRLSELSKENI